MSNWVKETSIHCYTCALSLTYGLEQLSIGAIEIYSPPTPQDLSPWAAFVTLNPVTLQPVSGKHVFTRYQTS